jgi:hypothetical protein
LIFKERRNEAIKNKKRKNGFPVGTWQLVVAALGFQGCYMLQN